MKKYTILLVFVLLISLFTFPVNAENADIVSADKYVESVDVYLPDIEVYVNGLSGNNFSVKASLDGENLKYNGATSYDPQKTSTCVYILADISGSVSSYTYSAVKSSVKAFINTLSSAQTVKFYTFSQDVTQILDGSESHEEAINKIDATNVTGNGYTALYDALYLLHSEAKADKDSYERQFAIVITDGVDEDNKAKRTFDETKNMLAAHDIPVYAMCMDYATAEAKDKLGEISRVSGGTNYIFAVGNMSSVFNEVVAKAFSCVKLSFAKSNNKAGDKDKNLSISIDSVALPVVTVYESSVRIKEDNSAPSYTVTYSAENKCLVVEYTEAVLGADIPTSYVITDSDGDVVPVESVSYDASTKTACLYFLDRFYSDTYTFDLSGVTDDSASANKPAIVSIVVTAQSPALKVLDHWWIILIPFFIVIIILLVLIVVKRKRKITNVKELFEVENENNYEVKHHIVNAQKGREIFLDIITDNVQNQIKTRITSSLIFGRSDTCDICIDDVKLSRQHFAFETQGNGDITICDLGSTNGTYINGMRVAQPIVLKPGDVVAAGLTKIKVKF